MTATACHVGLLVEQVMGHVTHGRALSAAAACDPSINITSIGVPYYAHDAWQRLPLASRNLSILLSLRARSLVRAVQRSGARFDALLYHTQVMSLFSLGIMRRIPTILSLDATPLNADPVDPARPSPWTRRPNGSGAGDRLKFHWTRAAFRRCAALTTWNRWARDSLVRDYGISPEKITVIPPGVDLDQWKPSPTRRAATGRPRLLFVGAQFQRKGGEILLEAFRGGLTGLAELDIVTSDRTVTEDLGSTIRVHRGLEINSPELRALYAGADVFVLPTLNDCTPIAILEAMASGLPVVATDVGAIREQVEEGATGVLIRPGDPGALAGALRNLLSDAGRRRAFGIAARARVERLFAGHRNYPLIFDLIRSCSARDSSNRTQGAHIVRAAEPSCAQSR